jgi:nitrate reductase cytochrome c-type subunit
MRMKTRAHVARWILGLLVASAITSPHLWPLTPGPWPPRVEGAENPPPGSSKRLPRMYDGAPPQIPHSIAGLQGLCLGCHLEGVQGATLVPHPDRPNCLQCHVPQDPSAKPFVRNTFGDPGPGRRR